jgi:hypothetical protein
MVPGSTEPGYSTPRIIRLLSGAGPRSGLGAFTQSPSARTKLCPREVQVELRPNQILCRGELQTTQLIRTLEHFLPVRKINCRDLLLFPNELAPQCLESA